MPQFPKSKLITTLNTPLSLTTSAAVRPKDFSFFPLNGKTEGQSMQCLEVDFQKTIQHNSSAHKNKTNQFSNVFIENEQMFQTQYQSEKRRNTTAKITFHNPHLFENCNHIPVQFDNNQCLTAQKISNKSLTIFPTNQNQNNERLVTDISLPTVVQPNNSQHYRKEQNPTAVQFNSFIQTQQPNNRNRFPSKITFNNTSTTLVSCTPSQPLQFPPTPENSFTNNQTAIFPPIAQHVSQP